MILKSLITFGALGLATTLQALPPKLTSEQTDFFEKKIRPVLLNSCYSCHSSGEKIKGGLLLDTREAVLKGGDSGPALVPGKPEKSLLLKAIRHDDVDLAMPPKEKLSDETVAAFEEWIRMGAPDPREGKTAAAAVKIDMEKGREHWAFRPVSNPKPPEVAEGKSWIKSPIDAFVLAKLKEKGLQPSSQADKLTLIRRVTFDLTGLPPTPKEVEAFVADKSENAFAKLVDRLLASPRYGERWARHWLDVARYADTTGDRRNGGRRDPLYPYAWTYRDYVIEAFNKDLPYDQFILQQLAADRLPESAENKKTMAALGFLAVGKQFMNNRDEVIDDRIDVVTKGLMGLTVSCARCHDHKFDPIPTADYYSLHGVFANSTEMDEGPMIAEPRSKELYEDYQKKIASVEEEVDEYHRFEEQRMIGGMLAKSGEYLLAVHDLNKSNKRSDSKRLYARQRNLDPFMYDVWEDTLRGAAKGHDPLLAPWLAFAALPQENFARDAKTLAAKIAANSDPEKPYNRTIAKAFAEKAPASLKEVSAVYTRTLADLKKAINAPDFDYRQRRSNRNSTFKPTEPLADAGLETLRLAFYGKQPSVDLEVSQMGRILGVQFRNAENEIRGKISVINMTHPGSPARAMAFEDVKNPRNSNIYIRGERGNRGPVVPRQFIEVLAGSDRKPFTEGSGRLELARAIANRDNPLTARVMVNRIWQHHFGQALVRTPSDFGTRSDTPTHPELLDHLATKFMDHGWSIKQIHRYILLSSTYQQDSKSNPKGMKEDPTNQWLWRMNIQRLDFEGIRDTMLMLSGKLDLTLGGQPVVIATASRDARYRGMSTMPESSQQNTNRRTIYAMVDREVLPQVFQTFDFANPDMSSGERYLTTVPQQALFMMNSPFVVEQAAALVERPDFQAQESNEAKARFLYRLLYQRDPSEKELKLALGFLDAHFAKAAPADSVEGIVTKSKPGAPIKSSRPLALDAWDRLAQVMLISNELIFVN